MTDPANSLPPEVVEAWRRGNKIEAIKRLRKATGLGLVGAKAALDALDRKAARLALNPSMATDPALGPGEVPRSKGGLWMAALMILVLVLAGWLYSVLA
jgi:hypothetical protein